MSRRLRRLLILAAVVAAVAVVRSYLFSVNERRYRDAFTLPSTGDPEPSTV